MIYDKILVLGGQGMLAQYILSELKQTNDNHRRTVYGVDRHELDASNSEALEAYVRNFFSNSHHGLIVNCVAYNNVDKAESDTTTAFKLNTELPKNLAVLCANLGLTLLHFSTGYVFDGTNGPYPEDAKPHAVSVYAQSKLKGENEIIDTTSNYYIIRTNLLFGTQGASELSKKSFVEVLVEAGIRDKKINAITDESNSLCYALDLAQWVVENFIDSVPRSGIYHGINEGSATWEEIVRFMFTDQDITIVPVSRTTFARVAHRPKNIHLQNTKLPKLRHWQDALAAYLSTRTTINK